MAPNHPDETSTLHRDDDANPAPAENHVAPCEGPSGEDDHAAATLEQIFGPVLHRVTRADLLRMGELIDVTPVAREAGFRLPVAIGRAAWARYVEVPPGVTGQDQDGRLWDVLWMLRYAIRREKAARTELLYKLHVRNDDRAPQLVTLKALCGPGDDGEPVITILLPDED